MRNGVTESYLYNADGERVRRTSNGVNTFYFGGLVEETAAGEKRHVFVFNGQTIAERDTTSSVTTVRYLHGDHLGSVAATSTSNTSPTVTKQYFTPWGEARHGAITTTDRNYTGQRKDDTGLLFYNARYYDPKLSRFLSADCQLAPVSVPVVFGNAVPDAFGNRVPPVFGNRVPLVGPATNLFTRSHRTETGAS